MSGGTQYTDRLIMNGIEMFTVTSDPNGALNARRGSVAFRIDAGNANIEYRNTSAGNTGTTWEVAGGGGLTWTQLALSNFSTNADRMGNLSGAVSESGGAITWPLISADQNQDIREAALHMMTLEALATLTGVTAASLTSGENMILVRMQVTAIERNVAMVACLMDRDLSDQANAYGMGTTIARTTSSFVLKGGWMSDAGSQETGNAPIGDTPWVVGQLHAFDNAGVNSGTMRAQIYEVSSDGFASVDEGAYFRLNANSNMNTIAFFAIGAAFRAGASGTAGNMTGTIHVAAIAAASRYYQTVT